MWTFAFITAVDLVYQAWFLLVLNTDSGNSGEAWQQIRGALCCGRRRTAGGEAVLMDKKPADVVERQGEEERNADDPSGEDHQRNLIVLAGQQQVDLDVHHGYPHATEPILL